MGTMNLLILLGAALLPFWVLLLCMLHVTAKEDEAQETLPLWVESKSSQHELV
jgi:heme/copper-type cytochrome/quinol oxidase subunit 4